MTAREHAECGAGVAHVGEIEKAIDDRDRAMKGHRPIDNYLGELIENDNRNQPTRDELPLRAQPGAPALRTFAQRAQTVGCAGSLPTSVSYFQQRSHFPPSALKTEIKLSSSSASKEITRRPSGKSTRSEEHTSELQS